MSFYTSLSGLKNAQTGLNVTAHNIANAETNGFKKSRVAFADVVAGSATSDPKMIQGIGATVEAINQNFALGPIEQTGSALDLAVSGEGFFAMRSETTGNTSFTRNGAFILDQAGFIQDGSGNRLQLVAPGGDPAAGPLVDAQVPAPADPTAEFAGISVGENGQVIASYSDGTNAAVGQIALANFISPGGLRQVGSSNWTLTGISGAPSYGAPNSGLFGGIKSGALERSNVDITEELVSLITAQRNFQANAKAIDTATQISQAVLNLRT